MGTERHIGVNLGGWLILEKWLTPSVFKGLQAGDEWELSQTPEGRKRIEQHRKTFITEADFVWLRDHGVTLLRLPVPYWAIVESEEYVFAGYEVGWTMQMAEKYGLKVLLDLHAAPGGQNVGDHSGRKGQCEWFEDTECQEQTLEILLQMAETYKDSPALWGVEILNEPEAKGHVRQLIRFYRRAYKELRSVVRPGTYTVFHDGFQPLLFTGSLWPRRDYPVIMDVHWYGFPIDQAKTMESYMRLSRWLRLGMARFLQLWQPIMVGEWSSVLPQRFFDAAPQDSHMTLLHQNIRMQQRVHALTPADMYWNYKAEGEGMWHFRSLVEKGILPLD